MTEDSTGLLPLIAKGDEAAFAEFYKKYEVRLFSFIKSKLNDPFEASDILNETFMEVWRKAGTFEGRSKESTWLFGIAYFKTMDKFRKNKPFLMDNEELPKQATNDPSALSGLLDNENAEHIKHCMDKLKPPHLAVIKLAFFEDMSYGEIGEAIDCPANTVKTRVFYAKEALKNCLLKKIGGSS